MSKLLCLVALALLAVNANGESRIIGGDDAVNGQFPHHAIVWMINATECGHTRCGGSIIGDRFVLTSSGCVEFDKPSNLLIIVGDVDREANATQYQVDKVILHPHADEDGNEVAVVRVDQPFEFTANVQPIRLPTADLPIKNDGLAVPVTFVGFGMNKRGDFQDPKSYPRILQYLNTTAIGHIECGQLLNDYAPDLDKIVLKENHICIRHPQDTVVCVRDNGGGFITRSEQPELIGLISFGWHGCPEALPSVPVRVYPHLEFIKEAMQN